MVGLAVKYSPGRLTVKVVMATGKKESFRVIKQSGGRRTCHPQCACRAGFLGCRF
jgi:hypothetical protein